MRFILEIRSFTFFIIVTVKERPHSKGGGSEFKSRWILTILNESFHLFLLTIQSNLRTLVVLNWS